MKEIKGLKKDIESLERFFKEHAIVSLHRSLQEAVGSMKTYFQYQKDSIKYTEGMFKDLRKKIVQKFSSITTKDKVLSTKEVAEYLSISYSTVQSMMFGGGLPYFRVGNRYKVKELDLSKWIERRKEKKNF